jgi:hypothetical protein
VKVWSAGPWGPGVWPESLWHYFCGALACGLGLSGIIFVGPGRVAWVSLALFLSCY